MTRKLGNPANAPAASAAYRTLARTGLLILVILASIPAIVAAPGSSATYAKRVAPQADDPNSPPVSGLSSRFRVASPAALPERLGEADDGLGDYDGDGRGDIIAENSNTDSLVVRRGRGIIGPTSFAGEIVLLTNVSGVGLFGHGDFDGDGRDDVALTFNDELRIRHNLGLNGTSTLAGQYTVMPTFAGYNHLAPADMDGNGYDDIVARRTSDGMTFVWLHAGMINGRATFATRYPLIEIKEATTFDFADVTGDGASDMVVVWPPEDAVYLGDFYADRRMDGTWVLKDYKIKSNWLSTNPVFAGRLNGDGPPELLAKLSDRNELRAHTHSGKWYWARPHASYPSSGVEVISTGWNRYSWLS